MAQRLTDPERTSPTAKTPGTLVSRIALGTGRLTREDEAVVVERDGAIEPVGVRCGSEEEEEERERDPFAVDERRTLELPVGTGVAVRAPNFRAWLTARTVSSEPLMPAGKPR